MLHSIQTQILKIVRYPGAWKRAESKARKTRLFANQPTDRLMFGDHMFTSAHVTDRHDLGLFAELNLEVDEP